MSMPSLAVGPAGQPTLASVLWPADGARLLRALVLIFAGTVALTVSAKTQVPFYPVPMTMQTFVVLVIGMTYGWRLGGLTLLAYLAEGAAGLPVFANTPERGIGLAYLAGPTGGYLVGFFVAAVVVGYLAERGWDRSVPRAALAMLAGHVIIFALGLLWLGTLIGYGEPLLVNGLYPFIPGAIFKLALAAAVLPLAWRYTAGRT